MLFKIKIKGKFGELEVEYNHQHTSYMYFEEDASDKGFSELHKKAFEELRTTYKELKEQEGDKNA